MEEAKKGGPKLKKQGCLGNAFCRPKRIDGPGTVVCFKKYRSPSGGLKAQNPSAYFSATGTTQDLGIPVWGGKRTALPGQKFKHGLPLKLRKEGPRRRARGKKKRTEMINTR